MVADPQGIERQGGVILGVNPPACSAPGFLLPPAADMVRFPHSACHLRSISRSWRRVLPRLRAPVLVSTVGWSKRVEGDNWEQHQHIPSELRWQSPDPTGKINNVAAPACVTVWLRRRCGTEDFYPGLDVSRAGSEIDANSRAQVRTTRCGGCQREKVPACGASG